jgi:predicted phage terminase large subunit-like protein
MPSEYALLDQFYAYSNGVEASEQGRLKEECERDLLSFVRCFWHITDPEEPLVEGWPLNAICDHLMAVTDGEITRLLMNVPPGFTKSLLTDVFWPAWEWGPQNLPHLRYLAASYTGSLTSRDNGKFRAIICSPLYRALWGDRFLLTNFQVTKVANNKTGWKLATSVGGVGTGERGNRVIVDDANNPWEVESETVRDSTNRWVREVMPDRLNNLKRDAIVCIQQRTHAEDCSGTLLEHGGDKWCHLMIPMEYDPLRHKATAIGWEDPRGLDIHGHRLSHINPTLLKRDDGTIQPGSPLDLSAGALAFPARFAKEEVEEQKSVKGPYGYAGQYQQQPVPRGGAIILTDWWGLWEPEAFPDFEYVVASLDTAIKEAEENDYNALTVWGAWRDEDGRPKLMLVNAWRARLSLVLLVNRVVETCRKHKADVLLIEDKTRGHDVRAEVMRLMRRREVGVHLIDPKGDKVSRAHAVVPVFAGEVVKDKWGRDQWQGGLVWAPDKDWAESVIQECAQFPRGKHDDYVDSVTQALIWMRRSGIAVRREEHDEDEIAARKYRKPRKPLYDV